MNSRRRFSNGGVSTWEVALVWKPNEMLQLGYTCKNLEQGIDYFIDNFGAGPFYVVDIPPGIGDYTYRGERVTGVTKNRYAFGYRGAMQFELFETDNPIFNHVLGDKDVAYHHCMQMSGTFERDRLRYAEAGFKTMGIADLEGVLIHYIDTVEAIGHYTELFDYDRAIADTGGAMFKAFEVMAAAAVDWDGKDRIRSIPEV